MQVRRHLSTCVATDARLLSSQQHRALATIVNAFGNQRVKFVPQGEHLVLPMRVTRRRHHCICCRFYIYER